jgi:hypothetical protein
VVSLTGCEQVEQAANDIVEKAKQSSVQALDEATQTGSIDQAKQKAAGLLSQANEYLSKEQRGQDTGSTAEANPASTL